jgi:2-keto-4-pentenoate hydratase/2-oxohepta-3-ene-1,7-dioic acid hydratase in catechol pathway
LAVVDKFHPSTKEMNVRIATFVLDGRRQVGLVSGSGDTVTPLALGAEQAREGAQFLIDARVAGRADPTTTTTRALPLREVRLEAPLPRPRRNLWCVGRNYHAHARELSASVFKDNDAKADAWPIVFTKVPECVVGPFDDVVVPVGVSDAIDYEAELAVVIGKGGKNIARAAAMGHVFGYTIVNDVTARDVQMRHQQWDLGKSFDTFCPMGPWIVTADELDGTRTRVRCLVNGELRQDAPTENMIFDIPTLIETISRGITLHPGDVIATGTPAGVGMGMKPPRYLKAGDVVRVEIDGLGAIENRFV